MISPIDTGMSLQAFSQTRRCSSARSARRKSSRSLCRRLEHRLISHDAGSIQRVVDDAVAVDDVEAVVGEQQRLRVVVHEGPASPSARSSPARGRDDRRTDRRPSHRAVARKLTEIGAEPAADFEHRVTAIRPTLTSNIQGRIPVAACSASDTTRACAAARSWHSATPPGCCSTGSGLLLVGIAGVHARCPW